MLYGLCKAQTVQQTTRPCRLDRELSKDQNYTLSSSSSASGKSQLIEWHESIPGFFAPTRVKISFKIRASALEIFPDFDKVQCLIFTFKRKLTKDVHTQDKGFTMEVFAMRTKH
jgi:hypothetical protein